MQHDGSLTLAPYKHESSSSHGAYSAYSSSSQTSPRQHTHTSGITPAHGSSRSNAAFPSNHGHSFQAFYQNKHDLIPVTSSSTRPQGVVRSCDIPDDDDDPRKRYKCKECGKGFDRPSSLEVCYSSLYSTLKTMLSEYSYLQTHSLRHSGDKRT